MAAAAARQFSRLAGRAFRHARIPLHFIDDVQIRIVHRRGGTRGGAVSIARPVPGISPPWHVQMVRNTDGVLRCRARAQASCQLHLLLLLLLHHVLHRPSTDIFRLHLPVHGINTLQCQSKIFYLLSSYIYSKIFVEYNYKNNPQKAQKEQKILSN